jgi:hypothetical protein
MADKLVIKGSTGLSRHPFTNTFKEVLLVQCYLNQSNLLSEVADGKLGLKHVWQSGYYKKLSLRQDSYPNKILLQYITLNASDSAKNEKTMIFSNKCLVR